MLVWKKYWYILLVALCVNIPLCIFGLTRTNSSIILKGDTTIVETAIEVENPYSQGGSLSTIYVISVDHSTYLQNFFAGASGTSDVHPMSSSYLHFTTQELHKAGRIQYEASINSALIQAYSYANCPLETTFLYFMVDYYQSSESLLRIGHKITGINGKTEEREFREELEKRAYRVNGYYVLQPGDVIQDSDGIVQTIEKEELIGGYLFYNINEETASPKFTIKESNVGGPSGGLLQTLALYNSLTPSDITKGKRIAGTGTIELDGTVGAIGGIQQKIYTAIDDHMDIFLCPKDNYEEALKAYEKLPNQNMKLFSVSTFAEALEILRGVE